ncbi:MAG TPA: HRDC domain-containing protein [bacterium]
MPQYELLARPDTIAEFVAGCRGEARVAVDLEADSLHSYREQICLVQLSSATRTAIADPLAGPGVLAGLAPLLADAAVQKVFHGGDYDVRLLKREGVVVRNLFDTMIAAQLAGRERFGLAALLEAEFGVVLDKRFQRADWSRRPLDAAMLDYAANDTAHLLALADRLGAELERIGRLAWAQEEFGLLELAEPSPPKKPWCLDLKGAGRLAPRQLARLQTLLDLRDELARSSNRPPFKVLGNEVLLAWAAQPPADRRAVAATTGANRPLLERIAGQVLEALARAEAVPDEQCPRPELVRRVPPTPAENRRLARLKAARAEASATLRIEAGLLVNGATLERLARQEPDAAIAALPDALKRWQREAVGDVLRHALAQ